MLNELQPIAAAVGHAISAWGEVETALCEVFHQMTGGTDFMVTHDAFYAVVSFEAKLKMTTATVERRLTKQPAKLSAWSTIATSAAKRSKMRNKLAHGQLMVLNLSSGPLPCWIPFATPAKIVENLKETRRGFSIPNGSAIAPLRERQIAFHVKEFLALAEEINAFRDGARQRKRPEPSA